MAQALLKRIISAACVVVVLCISVVCFQDKADAAEPPHLVDIELADASGVTEVGLGKVVTRSFTITSTGDQAYIRVKPSLSHNGKLLSIAYEDPKTDDWVLANDGWYYYKQAFGFGTVTHWDSAFLFPADIELEAGHAEIEEVIRAEAIQEYGAMIDWTKDKPWEGAFDAYENQTNAPILVDGARIGLGDGSANDYKPSVVVTSGPSGAVAGGPDITIIPGNTVPEGLPEMITHLIGRTYNASIVGFGLLIAMAVSFVTNIVFGVAARRKEKRGEL